MFLKDLRINIRVLSVKYNMQRNGSYSFGRFDEDSVLSSDVQGFKASVDLLPYQTEGIVKCRIFIIRFSELTFAM